MAAFIIVGPKCNVEVSCDIIPRFDPMLAVDPTDPNHMVGLCRFFPSPPAYQSQLEVQTTFDGGRSWSRTILVNAAGSYSTSDPWIGVGPNGSDVSIVALRIDTLPGVGPASMAGSASIFYSSNDGGRTWRGPSVISANPSFGSNNNYDGTYGAYDLSTQGRRRSLIPDGFTPSGIITPHLEITLRSPEATTAG
jgi:hypothetical protein